MNFKHIEEEKRPNTMQVTLSKKEKKCYFDMILYITQNYTLLFLFYFLPDMHYIINHEFMPSLMCTFTPSLMTSAVM